MVVITPNTGTSQGNVYIALIEQYHYVGLDKIEVPSNVCESESTDDSLNDVTIEEGDEHTRLVAHKKVCFLLKTLRLMIRIIL